MAYNTALCTGRLLFIITEFNITVAFLFIIFTIAFFVDDGVLYLCGCNSYSQCAISSNNSIPVEDIQLNDSGIITSLHVPFDVQLLPPVKEVSCGWSHILVICAG